MFGYVKTDLPNMYVKDTVLYKALYCGLCKGIGKSCGNKARLCLNYDLTFLSLLCHNVLNIDVKIEKERCCIHCVKKREMAKVDKLTLKIARLNVILAYHKIEDDLIDENKGRIKKLYFNSGYKRAKKEEPKLDKIVAEKYRELLELERKKCDSYDLIANPFGEMMKDIVYEIVGENDEKLLELSYALGKWIYLIDAIDDYDKDRKKGDYNVFVLNSKNNESKTEFIEKNKGDLQLLFGSVVSMINDLSKEISYKFNHDLIDNILINGIKKQTEYILEEKNEK